MTKILLNSDWHFNFNSQFDRTNSNGVSTRLQEIIDSILWAAETGVKQGATLFVTLGDLFERSDKLPTKEGLAIVKCLETVSSWYKARNVMALVGNHDQISSDHNIVSLFSNIVRVANQPTFLTVDGARLFLCPYIRDQEEFYKTMERFTTMDCLGKKYLLAHFWDTTVMGVDPEAIDLSRFNAKFFDRIFLGHYHVPTTDLSNLAVYVGTLLNKKFSETGPKGCWILDVETNTIEFFPNPNSPEFFSTEDTVILDNPEVVEERAYYRVFCDAENVVDISRILTKAKGYELLSKKTDTDGNSIVSIDAVEKRNSMTLKDFIFKNALLYTPENVSPDDFLARGKELLSDL
jgi:DNA repair exonuclease SbcCD nuclease subunit